MGTFSTRALVGVMLPAAMLVTLVWLVLARVQVAKAAGEVTNCNDQSDLAAQMNSGSGLITFNCGGDHEAATITITQAGGFNALAGTFYTIDGGNLVTLTGAGVTRLFDVRVNAALTLTNIILTDGHSFNGGGGNLPDLGGAILDEGYLLTLDHVTIRNSQSQTGGGAIKIITGKVLVQNSLLEGNQSVLGGGIDNAGPLSLVSTLTLSNTTLRNNQGLVDGGGGLYVGGEIAINNSLFDANQAPIGAGLYMTQGLMTVNNTTFSSNQASKNGGALYLYGSLQMNDSTLQNNGASNLGGGMYNDQGNAILTNCLLSANWANTGGGINNKQGLTSLFGTTLSGNSATFYGGGIANGTNGSVDIEDSTLSGNTAVSSGGGIYNGFTSSMLLNNSQVSGNSAPHGGAANNSGMLNVNATALSGNTAKDAGGGIYNYGQLSMTSSALSGSSTVNGGGIYNTGDATLVGSTLSGNSTSSAGGAIVNDARMTVTNSTLSGNAGGQLGGAIYNTKSLKLINATLSNNSAVTGSVLYLLYLHTTVVQSSIIAYGQGGTNCYGTITASTYSISSDTSCAPLLSIDPQLTGLGNYGGPTIGLGQSPPQVNMLKAGSPAIDAVPGNPPLATDERGLPRLADGSYDIGAVERQPNDMNLAPDLYLPLVAR